MPKPPRRLKVERFQELEGQSYPVLKFEVEIWTLAKVGGCKLDFTLKSMIDLVKCKCGDEIKTWRC